MSLTDTTGILLGFAFLFAVLGIAGILRSKVGLDVFVTRKIVHISVAHWWLIAVAFHDTVHAALVGPVVFTVLNYISYRKSLFPALEYRDKTANLGTIYFPVSLIVLVWLTFGGHLPMEAGTTGIFVMAYGDGLAALVGRRYGRRTFTVFGNTKSYLGSATMFITSSIVTATVAYAARGAGVQGTQLAFAAVLIGLSAMLLEMATPFGIDNITVPIGVTLMAGLVAGRGGEVTSLLQPVVAVEPVTALFAVGINLIVAISAYRRRSVSGSGALAGLLVGSFLFVASAGLWGLLMLFFLSSTMLGRFRPDRRMSAEAMQAKGARRDAWQVFANAGAPTVAAVVYLFGGGEAAVVAAVAGLAAATADTWSSEIGVLSRRSPISILSFRPVPAGVSGGVSVLGFAAGITGSLVIAVAGVAVVLGMGWDPASSLSLGVTALGLGTLGTVLDSLLGAGVQTRYRRPDGSVTERPRADDGTPHVRIQGIPGLTNDAVNFLTTTAITILAVSPGL